MARTGFRREYVKEKVKNLFFGYVMDSRCAPPLYEIGRILII